MPPIERFERSPEIQEKIDTVRRMPAYTEQEKAEKKESARNLRMDVLLENAAFMNATYNLLDAKPDIERDELIKELKKSANVAHPDSAKLFVDVIIHTRGKILDSLKYIGEEQEASGKDPSRIIFESLHKRIKEETETRIKTSKEQGHEPDVNPVPELPADEDVELRITDNYPLAICLEVEDEAYKYIDPRLNIGGSYISAEIIRLPETAGETHSVPIIVVKGLNNPDILIHEKGHALSGSFMTSLKVKNRITTYNSDNKVTHRRGRGSIYQTVWGEFGRKRNIYQTARYLETRFSEDLALSGIRDEFVPYLIESRHFSEDTKKLFKQVAGYALEEAKDELLAGLEVDVESENRRFSNLFNRLFNVKHSRTYDFLSKGLDIKEEKYPELHEALKTKYLNIATANTTYALDIARTYGKQPDVFEKRIKLFPRVLSQIPLSEWRTQLKAMRFEEEAKISWDLRLQLNKTVDLVKPIVAEEELSDEDRELYKAAQKLRDAAIAEQSENAAKPLFGILERLKESSDQLLEIAQSSEAYKNRQLVENARLQFGYLMNHTLPPFPGPSPTEQQDEFGSRLNSTENEFYIAVAKDPKKVREHIHTYTKNLALLEQEMKTAGLLPEETPKTQQQ